MVNFAGVPEFIIEAGLAASNDRSAKFISLKAASSLLERIGASMNIPREGQQSGRQASRRWAHFSTNFTILAGIAVIWGYCQRHPGECQVQHLWAKYCGQKP